MNDSTWVNGDSDHNQSVSRVEADEVSEEYDAFLACKAGTVVPVYSSLIMTHLWRHSKSGPLPALGSGLDVHISAPRVMVSQ